MLRASARCSLPVGEAHDVACRRVEDVERIAARSGSAGELRPARRRPPTSSCSTSPTSRSRTTGTGTASRRPGAEPLVIVRDVTFDLRARETFSLVGESGSGKSTIARTIGGLLGPLAGQITFEGRTLAATVDPGRRRPARDPARPPEPGRLTQSAPTRAPDRGSPARAVLRTARKGPPRRRGTKALEDVQLDASFASRYPDQLSGGERQRIAIARALAARPRLMLCDEILSALDVSVQTSIVELLRVLQAEQGIAYLFISHDLAVVRSLSHRVGVLYLGELCEVGYRRRRCTRPPYHPYTHMLLSAVPGDRRRERDLARCPQRSGRLVVAAARARARSPTAARGRSARSATRWTPPWRATSETHMLRCHIPLDELSRRAAASGIRVGALSAGDGPMA